MPLEEFEKIKDKYIEAIKNETKLKFDTIETLQHQIEKYREALIWCSGSSDFQKGGIAREGWLKLCAPLIDDNKGEDLSIGNQTTERLTEALLDELAAIGDSLY